MLVATTPTSLVVVKALQVEAAIHTVPVQSIPADFGSLRDGKCVIQADQFLNNADLNLI